MATREVEDSRTTFADGAGTASVVYNGPQPPYTRLTIASIALLVTGSTSVPECTVYDGPVVAPGRVRAAGRIGDRNTILGDGDVLFAGQQILVRWTGVTPGATCNAVLRGTASGGAS